MTDVYCSKCGKLNKNAGTYCKSCNNILKTDKINFGNKITSFNELFTEENYKKLENTYITLEIYESILGEINRIAKDNYIYDENKTTLENIYNLADQYTTLYTKHKGVALGYYISNEIFIDQRLPDSEQISTIIHELTHHIYAEILEQILIYSLNVEKSQYLEAFVAFAIYPPIEKFLNEYIAHTTEGQFVLHGCQNYGSFINLMNEHHIIPEENQQIIALGRTISNDITQILENYIDEKLRKNIIKQYTIDNIRRDYTQIHFEESAEIKKEQVGEKLKYTLLMALRACLDDYRLIDLVEEINTHFN